MRLLTFCAVLAFGVAALAPVAASAQDAETITGIARAIDADIIGFENKQRVILWGVDAPERSQTCSAAAGRYSCYDAAIRTLETLVSNGEVTCTLLGEPDPFRRRYGVCEAGGLNVNAELVRAGLALAYLDQTEDYVPAEEEARAAKTGLWQDGVKFEAPWEWRRTRTPGGFR